jgi:hypothetical protein
MSETPTISAPLFLVTNATTSFLTPGSRLLTPIKRRRSYVADQLFSTHIVVSCVIGLVLVCQRYPQETCTPGAAPPTSEKTCMAQWFSHLRQQQLLISFPGIPPPLFSAALAG